MQSQPDSKHLLQQCARSRENAFWGQFVVRFAPVLKAGVRRGFQMTGVPRAQPADHEDMLQEVYCHLLAAGCRRLRQCRGEGESAISAFLYRLAVRVVLDQHRQRLAARRGGGDLLQEGWPGGLEDLPASAPEQGEDSLLRRHGLRSLLGRYCATGCQRRRDVQIWLLATLGGFQWDEITRVLPGPVTCRMVGRALGRVRDHLSAVSGELAALL